MRKILLLALTFISFNVFSQDITVTPSPVVLTLGTDVVDKKVDMAISNVSGQDIEFYWTIDREGAPEEWQFFLCDVNLCYTPSVTSCPCSKPNEMPANSNAVLMMHILANGVAGTGAINLAIHYNCDGTDSVIDIPITFEVGTTSTEFADINDDITLYPNPALDMINLIEDNDVKQIEFYSIVGKKIKSLDHVKGQSHDVSELAKGIYLVRLLNKSNNILKVLRMTKE